MSTFPSPFRLTVFLLLTICAAHLHATHSVPAKASPSTFLRPFGTSPFNIPLELHNTLAGGVVELQTPGPTPRKPIRPASRYADTPPSLKAGIPYDYMSNVGDQFIDTILMIDGNSGTKSFSELVESSAPHSRILVLMKGDQGNINWDHPVVVDQGKQLFLMEVRFGKFGKRSTIEKAPQINVSQSFLAEHAAITVSGTGSAVQASHLAFTTEESEGVHERLEPVFITKEEGVATLAHIHLNKLFTDQELMAGNIQASHISYSYISDEPVSTPTPSGSYRSTVGSGPLRALTYTLLPVLGAAQSATTSILSGDTPMIDPGLLPPTMSTPDIPLIAGFASGVVGVVILGAVAIFIASEATRVKDGERPRTLQLIDRCRRVPQAPSLPVHYPVQKSTLEDQP